MANVLLKIENMLESVVQAALREEADERGLQLQTAKKIKSDSRSLTAGDHDKKVDEAEEEEEEEEGEGKEKGGDMSKRPVEIPDELPASITVDMIIDGIDAIRSARSLKKPEVREEFETYFNSLSSDEKIGLLAFVYGIAETLIGSEEGKGLDPSEEPYNIQIDADPRQDDSPSTTPRNSTAAANKTDTPIVVGGQ